MNTDFSRCLHLRSSVFIRLVQELAAVGVVFEMTTEKTEALKP